MASFCHCHFNIALKLLLQEVKYCFVPETSSFADVFPESVGSRPGSTTTGPRRPKRRAILEIVASFSILVVSPSRLSDRLLQRQRLSRYK